METEQNQGLNGESSTPDTEIPPGQGAPQEPPPEKNAYTALGAGIAIGAGVGVALGLALGNIALGIAIGISIGVAMGMALSQRGESPEETTGARRSRLVISIVLGSLVLLLGIILVIYMIVQ